MANPYGANTTPVGRPVGAEPAVRTPDGCVPVRQLFHGEGVGDAVIVPAPPNTNRDAVNVRACPVAGCGNNRQLGKTYCGPHGVAARNRAAKRAELNGDTTAD